MCTRLVVAASIVGVVGLTGCRSATPTTAADRSRAGCYSYSISPDRNRYRAGEPVRLVVEARNVTSHRCLGHVCGGVTAWIDIADAHGRQVFRTNPVGVLCRRSLRPDPVVRPGRSTAWESYTWPPDGSGTPPPGRYTARWYWLDDVSIHSPAFTVDRA